MRLCAIGGDCTWSDLSVLPSIKLREELWRIWDEIDDDGSGHISFEEFQKWPLAGKEVDLPDVVCDDEPLRKEGNGIRKGMERYCDMFGLFQWQTRRAPLPGQKFTKSVASCGQSSDQSQGFGSELSHDM